MTVLPPKIFDLEEKMFDLGLGCGNHWSGMSSEIISDDTPCLECPEKSPENFGYGQVKTLS